MRERRRARLNHEWPYIGSEAQHDEERRQANARNNEMLDKIGEATDSLAEAALKILETLPKDQQQDFLQSVFRRLVVQILYTADALDVQHASSLPFSPLQFYGHARPAVSLGASGELQSVVIDESLPGYVVP